MVTGSFSSAYATVRACRSGSGRREYNSKKALFQFASFGLVGPLEYRRYASSLSIRRRMLINGFSLQPGRIGRA